MNMIKAKKQVKDMLHHNFKYLFKETVLSLTTMHLTFQMDSRIHNLQMILDFKDNYCDILCFISPTVLKDEYYIVTLNTVNTINAYAKAFGRFYIDDCNDLVYSLRLGYNLLEKMPELFLSEVVGAIQFYEDIFVLLLNVAGGKKTYEECQAFIDDMWGK